MISIRYFNGKDYVDSGTRFSQYSGKVPHALISPYRTKIRTPAGNQIVTGRASHDLVECVLEYERQAGISVVAGSFVQKANGVKILVGGEHVNSRVVNTTFSTCPVFQAEAMLAGDQAELASRSKGVVTIGNAVVLGENSLILSGVTIGDGAVIGAGSVVATDLPAFAIAAGNPARVLKYRFEKSEISELQKVRWWELDYEFIRQHMKALLSPATDAFLSRFGNIAANQYAGQAFFVVLEFTGPDRYTIKGVEYEGRFHRLDEVAEIRAYFDQLKKLPEVDTVTVDPYLDRFLRARA